MTYQDTPRKQLIEGHSQTVDDRGRPGDLSEHRKESYSRFLLTSWEVKKVGETGQDIEKK
jgi:hypothetical protein